MQLRFRRNRAPDEIDGVKIPYDKSRRGRHRLAWYLILGLVLSPILYLGAHALAGTFSHTANGTVILDELEIRASEAGSVRELRTNPGDPVAVGETLAVLDSVELDSALARSDAQLDRQTAAERGAHAARATIEQELGLHERGVQYQRERRAAIERLFSRGAATLAELDEATARLAAAELSLLHARRELGAQAPDAAPAERAVLDRRSRALTAIAPFDGRTLRVLVKPGQYVAAGEPLMIVAQLDQPRVVAYVSPKFATHLEVGTPATVYFPDGMRLRVLVAATPKLTERMPPDLVDQFGLRPMTVVLQL